MGAAMNDYGVQWAKDHGAQIVRLVVEEENRPARAQVEKLGYRNTCVWILGSADTPKGPLPRERDRLHPASGADADTAVFLSGWAIRWPGIGDARAIAGRQRKTRFRGGESRRQFPCQTCRFRHHKPLIPWSVFSVLTDKYPPVLRRRQKPHRLTRAPDCRAYTHNPGNHSAHTPCAGQMRSFASPQFGRHFIVRSR